jgi:XTP/dITP diphosphohydrolase
MTDRTTMSKQTIVLATGNQGKVKELARQLQPFPVEIVAQAAYDVPEIAETGTTFVENAIIKARHASAITGLPAVADDSGIEVDALLGAPGVFSARYAGPDASDSDNVNKLLNALKDIPEQQRTARFHCVLVFLRHKDDPVPIICQGTWEGLITLSVEGENGFGYDPIFWVPQHNCTSAQLKPEQKQHLSHRGQAMKKMIPMMSVYFK